MRDAREDDGAACAAIYAPYVSGTAVSFERMPPAALEMAARITSAQRAHAWLVLEDRGRVVGYAYGGPWRAREAYRWACEVSVYVELSRHRTGSGRALYEALLGRLAARGYRTALAGMTLPNEPSERLHTSLGFEPVGTFRHVGWKHDAWHDVGWFQKVLGPDEGPPAELV